MRLVASDPEAYDRFYNVFANPMLWFIQHYLWDLSNAPDIRRNEVEAFEYGYNVVNEDLARAVVEEIEGVDEPVVMVHDYHLYTLPALVRRARPDVFLHHFVHIPWTQSDAWRVLPNRIREEIYDGLLANDIIGFHTRVLPAQLPAVLPRPDGPRGRLRRAASCASTDREVWVRATRCRSTRRRRSAVAAVRRASRSSRRELLRRRREHLILRVDRADLSKNVLRGFSAFDLFLEQHPEFREKVTFIAQLMPSRTDVPEYAEYLERIEALVAVVNHRHGTPDWMPIQLKLRDDLEEAVASYKHYDVLLVNAMFDGMNLVAKEGPLVNERDGVSILSENTGAHEELGEFALSVNPFDIQELADSIHAALTMAPRSATRRLRGAQGDRHGARPGRLDRRPARGHPQEGGRGASRGAHGTPNSPRRRVASARRGAGRLQRGRLARVARRRGACGGRGRSAGARPRAVRSARGVRALAARRPRGRVAARALAAAAGGRRRRGLAARSGAGARLAARPLAVGRRRAPAGAGARRGARAGSGRRAARRRGQATTRATTAGSASARATLPQRMRRSRANRVPCPP